MLNRTGLKVQCKSAIAKSIAKISFKNATSLKENKQRIVILTTLLLKQIIRQPNGYRIMTFNINCLVNNSLRIALIDVLKRNQPHVLCLQEVNIPQIELQDLVDPL